MIPVLRSYHGGRTLLVAFAVAGVLGMIVFFIGLATSLQRALYAYLWGFSFWAFLVVASLLWLAIFHAAGARWPVVLRRMLETLASTSILLPILFLPIAIGLPHLFPWASKDAVLPAELQALMAHRHSYLNPAFFLFRAYLYFAIWIAASELLLRLSRKQDLSAELGLTVLQRYLAGGALPFIGFAFDLATTDWVMSLDPEWASSIFGLYVMSASVLCAIALLTIIASYARGPELFGNLLSPAHHASLGKLLLGFTAFWAYIGFCQYMLIYIANKPTEIPWLRLRTTGGWAPLAEFLVAGQWALPMFLLLSKDLKVHRHLLSAVAAWILFAHVIDMYWVVLPALDRAAPNVHWTDPACFIGVGGMLAACALFRLRGHPTLPVGDPYLIESLGYSHL